jgi:hypothetical protein
MLAVVDVNPIAARDKRLDDMERKIAAKRALLLGKQQQLSALQKDNAFLGQVRDDYQRHYAFMVEEKEREKRAMNMLHQYVDDIMRSGKLTAADLQEAKQEQEGILSEVKQIQRGIEEIMGQVTP